MNAYELLELFRRNNIGLTVDGANLRCSAPRGVLTPELLAALKQHKPELIMILAARGVPLSFPQRQLWFLDQLAPGNPFYNNPVAVDFDGELDVDALRRGLTEVVRRHEALRTVFRSIDGEPCQIVRPAEPVALPVIELPADSAGQFTEEDARTAFNLAEGPLLRANLLKLAPGEHRLVLNVHHIVADGWSIGILVREIATLYGAYVRGQTSPLSEPSIQYPAYALRERQRLQGTLLEEQLAYWTNRLADAPTLLALPTDRPRPAVQRYLGRSHTVEVGAEVARGLRKVGQAGEATFFMSLMTTLSVLLWRYSGQDDVCVGTPFANRGEADLEGLIGHFVNTLVIRNQVAADKSFEELLQHVRTHVLDAYAHADVPFDRLVETVNPERHISHTPLFQVMLVVQNMPRARLELPGLTMRPVPTSTRAAKFDLAVEVTEQDERLRITFEYNTDLFDDTTIARMTGHYVRLLEQVVAEPARPVGELRLLSPAERHRQLYEWNATEQPPAGPASLVERIEAQARTRPGQTAVVCDQDSLDYATLDRRANHLAHCLVDRGVRPDQTVGLRMSRSADLIVAILGVLKAGAGYVPLEPTLPGDRITTMIEDAETAVVLDEVPAGERPDAPGVPIDADSLAYVIYTSGSAGRPKGVAVSHGSVANLLDHWVKYVGALPGEPAALWSSFGFDVSVQEIMLPLTTGGVLHVVPEDVRADPGELMAWLRTHRIAQAYLPPAFVKWIEEDPAQRLASSALRQLLVGVEPLAEDALYRMREILPGLRIVNGYGPTESTVYSTAYLDPRELARQCPIGRPLANTRVYLLDDRLEPVPVGVTGEIHIGGAGLARGYLGRPELTDERFVPDPFVPGERMYRTGDLARYLSDGVIEYVGRGDHQVKVRGFRVELGEIEAALLDQPGVREAAVLLDGEIGETGDARLVAAIGRGQAVERPASEWRAALSQRLPGYMIPSLFVELPNLPQTPNGKLDRVALLRHTRAGAPARVNQASPRDQIELTLYQTWKQLLLQPDIGIQDNFFDVGGTSISAIKLAHAIRESFGVTLPVRDIMLYPTIEALGGRLRQGSSGRPPGNLIEFRPGNARVICVHPAGGTAFCYLSLAKALPETVGVYGIQSPGVNPGEEFLATVEAMAESYLRLVEPLLDGPLVLTGLSYGGLVAHEMGRRLALSGRDDLSVVLLDTLGTDDPVLRARIEPVDMAEFRDKLVKFNGMYPGIDDQQVEQYFRIYNHNRLTMRDYLTPASPGRLVLVQATGGRDEEFLAEIQQFWRSRAGGGFLLRQVHCDHWEMLETAEVHGLAALLESELARET